MLQFLWLPSASACMDSCLPPFSTLHCYPSVWLGRFHSGCTSCTASSSMQAWIGRTALPTRGSNTVTLKREIPRRVFMLGTRVYMEMLRSSDCSRAALWTVQEPVLLRRNLLTNLTINVMQNLTGTTERRQMFPTKFLFVAATSCTSSGEKLKRKLENEHEKSNRSQIYLDMIVPQLLSKSNRGDSAQVQIMHDRYTSTDFIGNQQEDKK